MLHNESGKRLNTTQLSGAIHITQLVIVKAIYTHQADSKQPHSVHHCIQFLEKEFTLLTFSHSALHQLLELVLPVDRIRPVSPYSFVIPVSVLRSQRSCVL